MSNKGIVVLSEWWSSDTIYKLQRECFKGNSPHLITVIWYLIYRDCIH
jgi:hypothetical protein